MSGYLVKDLIEHFGAKSVLDPMAGSYTTRDVCEELGIHYVCTDLKQGMDALSFETSERFDLVVLHPPYWRMINYSDDPRDLSNAGSLSEFMQRISRAINHMARFLAPTGRIVVLIGNWRKDGKYYPLGACLEVLFMNELRDELIKVQHNVKSMGFRYKGSFIPIMHEKVLIFAGFKDATWEDVVQRALLNLGGQATLADIYVQMAEHPKTADNPTWQSTARRVLQEKFVPVSRGLWQVKGGMK